MVGAVEAYTEALRLTPNNSTALENRGMAYVQLDDAVRALADLNLALAVRPSDADLLKSRAWAQMVLDHEKEAHDDFTAVLKIRPNDAYSRQNLGHLAGKRGDELFHKFDLQGAIDAYSEALKMSPDDGYNLGNRGIAYAFLAQNALAIADLDRALDLMPAQPDYLTYRAGARWRMKDLDGALEDYAAVLRIKPRDVFALRQRGQIFLTRENWQAALAELDQAAAAGDSTATLKSCRGRALSNLSRYDEASSELEAALKIQPGHPTASYDLVWIKAACPNAALRHGQRARELARTFYETLNQPDASWLSALAAAEAECGNFAEAVRRQEEAIKLSPDFDQNFHQKVLDLYRAGRPYRFDME